MAERASGEMCGRIRDLASDPKQVATTRTVAYDLMGLGLTKTDICDEIIKWINAEGRVKVVCLHSIPDKVGESAFEMKPCIDGAIIYIKVMIDTSGSNEQLLILSSHRDH